MIWLRWLVSTLLGLCALISVVFLSMISSTAGSVWLIDRLINASELNATVQGVSGRLIDHIQIDSLHLTLQDSGDKIILERADLVWDPLALFAGQIRVRGLSIEAAQYHADAMTVQKPAGTMLLPEINLPWPVYVDQLDIHSLQMRSAENTRVISQFQLSGDFKGARLNLYNISLELADAELVLEAGLVFTRPFEFDMQLGVKQGALGLFTNVSVLGTPETYQFSGEGKSNGMVYPLADVRYRGRGSISDFEISELSATGLDGTLTAKGGLHWQDVLKASLEIRGSGLNIGKLNSQMPGEVNFNGKIFWQKQAFDLQLNANGSLLDYPLELSLHSNGNEELFLLKEARMQSGPNHLQLSGEGGSEGLKQLKWQLQAPKLSAFHKALSGSVNASGQLHGKWAELQGGMSLRGDELKFKENRIETLDIDIEPLLNGRDQFQLTLKANEVWHRALAIGTINLISMGTKSSQSMDIALHADAENTFLLHAEAQDQGEHWQLKLSDSQLNLAQWPALNQPEVATIMLKTAAQDLMASLSPYCLIGPDEQICLEGKIEPTSLTSAMTLKNIPVRRFKHWLRESEHTDAMISGEVSLTQRNQHWQLISRIGMDSQNQLEIELGLQQPQQQLSGNIQARMDTLQWLALLNETLSHSSGHFEASLDVNGTLAKPGMTGQLRLSDAAVNIPETGTSLEQIGLIADIRADQRAQIRGEISSGEGEILVSGDAKWWPLSEWELDLALRGENFKLLKLPELSAVAAPDLVLNISSKSLLIAGDLEFSQLLVALQGLSDQAVVVSEDARIIGAGSGAAGSDNTTASAWPVTAKINVLLGNDNRLTGLGLNVALGGEVTISTRPGKPLRANGKIDVLKGSYTAYGQNLSLQQSHLVFNGPPGEPGLDLKAERKTKAVTVGVLIQGTLQQPQSSLYSDPDMPDSDALAYLLTGRALSAANGEDGTLMLSALTELGVKGSAGLVEKIQNSTGLSTFELDTGDRTSETALKLGRYLTPQLYVQYAKKIFSDSSSIEARYEISDKFYIETQSGEDSSIDLKYQFER